MARDPVEIIRALSAHTLAGFPGEIYSLVAEDFVFLSFDGPVYVGHEGLATGFEQQLREWADIGFRIDTSEHVGEGWVLTKGDLVYEGRDGTDRRQPGHWLAHVREDRIAAVLYYRTLDEARNALKLERPRP